MSCDMKDKDWSVYRDEAKNLGAIAEEMFKQGDHRKARAIYREAAERALLALYAVPPDDKKARKALGELVQALCEKTEERAVA